MPKQAVSAGPEQEGSSATSIRKSPTRVRGLDAVLHGGLPASQTTLISGGPGSGKTMLALEIAYRAALAGEPALFLSFEESAEAIRRNALSMGWDLQPLEEDGKLAILDGRVDPAVVRAGDFDIGGLLAILGGQTKALGARYVAIDAIDGLLRILQDPAVEREQLEILHRWLLDSELTSMITVKVYNGASAANNYDFLDYMVDCVIELDQRVDGQISTRRIRVLKYRGSSFQRNEHPFAITAEGIRIVPVSGLALAHQSSDRLLSTGHEHIDRMLGGGLVESSIALISGASGTGKTSLACHIARAACDRGERVLYLQFEEAPTSMVERMRSPGIDLQPALERGLLLIDAAMPEAMGIEEHLIRILDLIEEHGATLVVIDAISAASRMSTAEAEFDFLMRLTCHCRREGITCLLTNQSRQSDRPRNVATMGLSSLIDTVIVLAYQQDEDVFHRTLLVLKSRGMQHSSKRERFQITDDGFDFSNGSQSDPEA